MKPFLMEQTQSAARRKYSSANQLSISPAIHTSSAASLCRAFQHECYTAADLPGEPGRSHRPCQLRRHQRHPLRRVQEQRQCGVCLLPRARTVIWPAVCVTSIKFGTLRSGKRVQFCLLRGWLHIASCSRKASAGNVNAHSVLQRLYISVRTLAHLPNQPPLTRMSKLAFPGAHRPSA